MKITTDLKNNIFFYLYILLVIGVGFLLLVIDKEQLFLLINNSYNPFLGQFFRFYTHVGDGLFFIGLVLVMLFINYYFALVTLTCYLIPSLISQLLKKLVFASSLRPVKYFEGKQILQLTEGVINHSYNSFPSGHTLTAFAMFFLLSMMSQNKLLQVIYFFLAVLVGLSRIYIAQHFVEDTYFGSLIGMILTYFICLGLNNYTNLSKTQFFQKSLLYSN